jgi:hypothetical protein
MEAHWRLARLLHPAGMCQLLRQRRIRFSMKQSCSNDTWNITILGRPLSCSQGLSPAALAAATTDNGASIS